MHCDFMARRRFEPSNVRVKCSTCRRQPRQTSHQSGKIYGPPTTRTHSSTNRFDLHWKMTERQPRSQNFMYRFTRNSICVEHVRFSGCGAALYGFCAEVVHTAVIRQAVLQQRAYHTLTTTSSPPEGVRYDGWVQHHFKILMIIL